MAKITAVFSNPADMLLPVDRNDYDRSQCYVAGIDLSFTDTGVVIFDPEGVSLAAKSIKSSKAERGILRIRNIMFRVREILAEHLDDSRTLIVEEEYGRSGNMQLEFGMLHGVMDSEWFDMGHPVIKVNPTTFKCFVCGSSAEKDMIRLDIHKRWGYEHPNNNVLDAYGMAQLGRVLLGQVQPRNKYEAGVIQKVIKHAREYCPDLNVDKVCNG